MASATLKPDSATGSVGPLHIVAFLPLTSLDMCVPRILAFAFAEEDICSHAFQIRLDTNWKPHQTQGGCPTRWSLTER